MNIRLAVLALSYAFVLIGCKDSAIISGVVAAGLPVAGVPVTITDAAGNAVTSAPTDRQGRYSLRVSGQNLQPPFILTAPFTEIDGATGTLSSITNNSTSPAHANLTPVTSMITQRVLATVLSGAPAKSRLSGKLTSDRITQATQEVTGTLAPLFAALKVPAAASSDPVGSSYTADPAADAMDAIFEVARFNVRSGTIAVGFDDDQVIAHIPASGPVDAPGVLTPAALTSVQSLASGSTATPIRNVIVVVGENHTFDGLFAAYQPPAGQSVMNLLSQQIINADGTPGPNFSLARQNQAQPTSRYTIDLTRTSAYGHLPQGRSMKIRLPSASYAMGL